MIDPVNVFYSYSHKDQRFRNELETHLAHLRHEGLIQEWHDRQILAGQAWENEINTHIASADIILLLVSPDFLNSKYCYKKELRQALDAHEQGKSLVIPIILRPSDWKNAPFAKIQGLPLDAKPIVMWRNRDEAWLNVTQGIRLAINGLRINNLKRSIQALSVQRPLQEMHEIARHIAENNAPDILATHLSELANCFREVSFDPTTQYWLAISIGEANTQMAKALLLQLKDEDFHPYAKHGINEALEFIEQ